MSEALHCSRERVPMTFQSNVSVIVNVSIMWRIVDGEEQGEAHSTLPCKSSSIFSV